MDIDDPKYKIGQELPRLPYESLYHRCKCGRIGLTLAVWREFGRVHGCNGFVVVTPDGQHWAVDPEHPEYDVDCPPVDNLPHEIQELRKVLGAPFPGVQS